MEIQSYIDCLDQAGLIVKKKISAPHEIKNISYNSKEVTPGTLFLCKGAHFKPEYLTGAIAAGACCYLAEQEYDVECDYIIVSDIRRAMGYIANLFHHKVWEKLNLIGITGTKGKSTTTYFVRYILDEYLKSQKKPQIL